MYIYPKKLIKKDRKLKWVKEIQKQKGKCKQKRQALFCDTDDFKVKCIE